MTTINVPYTHLFPGLRVSMPVREEPITLLFADGSHAAAEILDHDDGEVLSVDDYTTAAGTAIPAKRWPVRDWSETDVEVTLTLGTAMP